MIENCRHCGKQLKRTDVAFCPNCGTPLGSQTGQVEATVHGGSLAKIVVQIPNEETREEFLSKAVTTVGRSRKNMLVVASPIVSSDHARLDLTRKGHTITDLNSTNGTFVNGHRLKPNQPLQLKNNDIIRFSDTLGNSASLTYMAPTGFSDIIEANISRQLFSLTEPIAYIGRNPKNAIPLEHPAVSWNHAKVIRHSEDSFTIQDLSSHNGTFLNGKQLRQRREYPLTRGDVGQLGPINLGYQGAGKFTPFTAERNFRLEAVALQKQVYPTGWVGLKNKAKAKTILQKLDLVINPREFVAVVGGSGAGKSTLLKALSGLSPASSGTELATA
jgi:pSer/pThr/pTyr-binding forkhead associated (FHA) protein